MTVLYVCGCGFEKVVPQKRLGEFVARPKHECKKVKGA